MQRCSSVSNRISDLGEHLLNINTLKSTHIHTHFKSCFDQGSATLLEPHLAGFYGNSRLGPRNSVMLRSSHADG